MAKRDQVGIALLIDPLPALDVLFMKIAEMSDRAAKGCETEAGGNRKNFQEGTELLMTLNLSRAYLRRLQVISNDLPLVVTELGLASEVHGELSQAQALDQGAD